MISVLGSFYGDMYINDKIAGKLSGWSTIIM